MTDAQDLVPPGSGWKSLFLLGINDRGQMVGKGLLNGKWRPFLMTPR